MKLYCVVCKKSKEVRPYRKDTFKFCSTKCKHESLKGKRPWNYGKKYTEKQKSKLDVSGLKIGRHKRYHQCLAKTYGAIHYWVRKNKGKAIKCERCGSFGGKRGCAWSNKDHLYEKNLRDYTSLCDSCHFKYDVEAGLREFAINPRAKK